MNQSDVSRIVRESLLRLDRRAVYSRVEPLTPGAPDAAVVLPGRRAFGWIELKSAVAPVRPTSKMPSRARLDEAQVKWFRAAHFADAPAVVVVGFASHDGTGSPTFAVFDAFDAIKVAENPPTWADVLDRWAVARDRIAEDVVETFTSAVTEAVR